MATATRQRLIDGALEAIRRHGIAAISARTIATTAGVNQALIFYHFGSMPGLLAEACQQETEVRIEHYRARLGAVNSLDELLDLGRRLHAEEQKLGNVAILAQLLAGAGRDKQLAPAVSGALRLWTAEIEKVLARLLAGSPFASVIDIPGLATCISAAFIGIELFDGVDTAAATNALDALQRLAILVE